MTAAAAAAVRRAVIALGANLGDRAATLQSALDQLGEADGVQITAVSAFIETPALTPAGVDPSKPPYVNAVALATTTLAPVALLDVLAGIEAAHGRERTERWGDRTLDLDLIDVEGTVLDSPRLTLPHPRAAERDFVLMPWLDVDPDAVLTGRGRVAELLTRLQAGSVGS